MSISLPTFVIAVALLWFPRAWMHRGATVWRRKSRIRSSDWHQPSADGVSLSFRREFTKARNYHDFVRAGLGTWALIGGYGVDAAIRSAVPLQADASRSVLLIQITVLFIGLLVQFVRWERHHISLTAPIFYLAGITMAFGLPVAAICAFAIAWVLTPVIPSAQGFLTINSVVLGAVGLLLQGPNLLLIVAVGLCFFPVLVSLLARKPLVVFSRRSVTSSRSVNA